MEKISLSSQDLNNLQELFSENYFLIKQIRNYEKRIYDNQIKIILKKIRDVHEDNLLTIMKLIDHKERIL